MSTRATYKIDGVMFYVHHDGYPTGAAWKFAAMIGAHTVFDADGMGLIERRNGGLPFAFIRGVMDAEFTKSHETHGDTEYRYDVLPDKDGSIKVTYWKRGENSFLSQGSYDLAEFLDLQRVAAERQNLSFWNRIKDQPNYPGVPKPEDRTAENAKLQALEDVPVVVKVAGKSWNGVHYTYATLPVAKKVKAGLAKEAAKFASDNPNKKNAIEEMRAWRLAIDLAEPKKEKVD